VSIRPFQWYIIIKLRNKKPNEVLGFSEGMDSADAVRNLLEQAPVKDSACPIIAAPWPSPDRPKEFPSFRSNRA
jgi:hypothetical protein